MRFSTWFPPIEFRLLKRVQTPEVSLTMVWVNVCGTGDRVPVKGIISKKKRVLGGILH